MKVYIISGYRSGDLTESVNQWLDSGKAIEILDIQYTYDDGFGGVMIVYEPVQTPELKNGLKKKFKDCEK